MLGASRSEVLEEFNPQQSRFMKEASWDTEVASGVQGAPHYEGTTSPPLNSIRTAQDCGRVTALHSQWL